MFSTSCPQVFLALFAVPKDLDLASTEMHVFLHCCLGEIQLVHKGSGKDEDCLSQVRILKTHIAMKRSPSSLSLPWLWASRTITKEEMVPRHLSSGTDVLWLLPPRLFWQAAAASTALTSAWEQCTSLQHRPGHWSNLHQIQQKQLYLTDWMTWLASHQNTPSSASSAGPQLICPSNCSTVDLNMSLSILNVYLK